MRGKLLAPPGEGTARRRISEGRTANTARSSVKDEPLALPGESGNPSIAAGAHNEENSNTQHAAIATLP